MRIAKVAPLWEQVPPPAYVRSLYCFACGSLLRSSCSTCNEPIMSLQFRFCPYCGQSYKETKKALTEPN